MGDNEAAPVARQKKAGAGGAAPGGMNPVLKDMPVIDVPGDHTQVHVPDRHRLCIDGGRGEEGRSPSSPPTHTLPPPPPSRVCCCVNVKWDEVSVD